MRFFLLLLLLVVLHLCFAEPGVGRSSSNEVNSEALSIASIVEALSSQTAEEELEFGEKPPGSFSGFPKSYEVRHLLLDPDDPVAHILADSHQVKSSNSILSSQNDSFRYPVHIWVDGEDEDDLKIRVEDNNGLNKEIKTARSIYTVHPQINRIHCGRDRVDPDDPHPHKDRYLPQDMKNWTYAGPGMYEGETVEVYQSKETYFDRVAYYVFYIGLDGAPLYLSSMGQDYFSGAHFDEYIYYFTSYKPGRPDPSVFEWPDECKRSDAIVEDVPNLAEMPTVLQMNFMLPRIPGGHLEYDEFSVKHNRRHESTSDYQKRLKIFLRNRAHIENHNKRNGAHYTLELNKFADYTDEEFAATSLGHLEKTEEIEDFVRSKVKTLTFEENNEIPENFTWYDTLADGPVKDQSNCGGCWAFAAAEAMKGAWYIATNETVSLSEQEMVDCSWIYFNHACDGGFTYTAILYAVDFGIASEFLYPYKGYDDYCDFKKPDSEATFADAGKVESFNADDMKRALIRYGPLAVSMDADHLDFRFYKNGIFVQPECEDTRTNHAVALVGYGVENGVEYYLLKNSWSKYWGDRGYIKMSAEYPCGVTYSPYAAIVDPKAAAKRREELRQRST